MEAPNKFTGQQQCIRWLAIFRAFHMFDMNKEPRGTPLLLAAACIWQDFAL